MGGDGDLFHAIALGVRFRCPPGLEETKSLACLFPFSYVTHTMAQISDSLTTGGACRVCSNAGGS
jgi:hypothetical protein